MLYSMSDALASRHAVRYQLSPALGYVTAAVESLEVSGALLQTRPSKSVSYASCS